MTCRDVRDNLVAYLDGELHKKTVMALHRHFSTCEACVQEEIELRHTKRLLNQFRFDAVPDNFDEQLYQKIKRLDKPGQKMHHDGRRIVYAVAATIILMIGLQVLGAHLSQSMQTPVHFKDFPTARAIFQPEKNAGEPSLKERMLQRYGGIKQEKASGKSILK